MLEKSVLNDEIIKHEIEKNYGLKIIKVSKILRGSANLFCLTTNNSKQYILKEFQSYYDNMTVNKEAKIIKHLQKDNLCVPTYIKTLSNEFYFKFNDKTIILQKYIDGYIKDTYTGTKEQIIESAKFLGLIVKSLEKYPNHLTTDNVEEWCSEKVYKKSIEKYTKFIKKLDIHIDIHKKIKMDLEDKIIMINNIKNLDLENIKKITHKNTHGDYSIMQFIYKDEQINAIIDFVSAKTLPVVWEVIRSYSYIDKCQDGNLNINNLIDYVKEFNKHIKLNKYDLLYMPYVYLIQILTSSYGYKQYINNSENKNELIQFAFTRTNLARYLFQNSQSIGKKLMKEVI